MNISNESDSFLGDLVSADEVTGQLRIVTEIHVSKKGPFRVLLGERMGKRVIIKTLKEEHIENRQFLMMLRKEFEIGVSLSHPGIVSIIDYQTVDGLGECIIEEYIDGESLETLLQKDEIEAADVYSILKSLTDTLVYIHRKGIVHSDLKPSNIMVSSFYGMPKIIDFGFSDSLEYVSLKFDGGTSEYIAPERRDSDYTPNPASDIWSMGVIIGNLAKKLKGNPRYSLQKIADKCRKPLEERVSSAEELLSLLVKSEGYKRFRKLKVIGFAVMALALVSIPLTIIFTHRPSKTENPSISSKQIDSEKATLEEPTVENVFTPAPIKLGKNAVDIPESGNINNDKESVPMHSLNKKSNTGTIEKGLETQDYGKEACDFAYRHIQETIADLKKKGLYKKAVTIGEQWNSRYIYDNIINDVREYVDKLPIASGEERAEVRDEAVNYARKLLADEEKKLDVTD